ncbi:hypothetical protein EUX98_g4249 [Antrodiella citrinella]|uniref:Uncharacterized protein n=1 Tax=Antrodiella citrinella TaxID=2447956 RepID=A0A4S4MVH6_9APHY|nr:hypothetical protein EUX98_g4249 [Antrodiella citrinella]
MPAKAHRTASGLTRTHSRTSSTGSSKANLGLQLTQKDPVPPRFTDNKKRNAHVHHEAGGRNTSPFPRNNSTVRVQSKEQLQPAILRRAPTPQLTANKTGSSKQKVGFSISSPSEADDDEWVSSESGAATPLQDTDANHVMSPVEPHKPSTPRLTSHVNGFGVGVESSTPRARTPPLPRVETVRPETSLISSQQQQHHHYQSQAPLPQKITRMLDQEHGTPWGTQPQLPQQPTPSSPSGFTIVQPENTSLTGLLPSLSDNIRSPQTIETQQLSRNNHDRQRTISTSSTFAALSSLAMRSTPSPPRTPLQQFTVTFPPADKEGHLEPPHPLLPPPYLASHLTILEYRNPLAESYDRVIRAKQAL